MVNTDPSLIFVNILDVIDLEYDDNFYVSVNMGEKEFLRRDKGRFERYEFEAQMPKCEILEVKVWGKKDFTDDELVG
jgi:hypothetical protein